MAVVVSVRGQCSWAVFVGSVPEKLGFLRYNQEIQFGKGVNLVDQYLSKVCGKNYLNDGSVKG